MFKKKFNIFLMILIAVITVVVYFVVNYRSIDQDILQPKLVQSPILFYGDVCPHCAALDRYLKMHPTKLVMERKEVFHHAANLKILIKTAKTCGLLTNTLAVPFLWTGSKCIVGKDKIVNYLKQHHSKKDSHEKN